jgi:DNA polymerase I-like protein with 3'-5' exonuclease and polymerase domains
MKVTGYGSIRPGSGSKKTSSTSSAGSFADILALSGSEDAHAASALSDVGAASALSNLLSLQEISEEDVRRKKLMQQGANMLDTLEQLRQQLLMGTIPSHLLQDLSRQLALQKQKAVDPKLNDVIEEIELRLAVELAKLEMAQQNQVI